MQQIPDIWVFLFLLQLPSDLPFSHDSVLIHILREWPPGFGGVERVAHEMVTHLGGVVYSLSAKPPNNCNLDPLPVTYERHSLPRIAIGRLLCPLPSFSFLRLIFSSTPLHGHLPSPGVLFILVIARCVRPRRLLTVHWHCFLESSSGLNGFLFAVYQWFALLLLPLFSSIVTTSPILKKELVQCGCASESVFVLPCCLNSEQEIAALSLPYRQPDISAPLSILYIGRLDSYKRIDWLLDAHVQMPNPGV